jgi:hypothetical protein
MRRLSLRSMIVVGILLACTGSCGLLIYSLSGLYQTTATDDLPGLMRSCTDSTYHMQYCLGLVPTVPAMYPGLYHSESRP